VYLYALRSSLCLVALVIFLSRDGAHPALHSFPTRRSSDLVDLAGRELAVRVAAVADRFPTVVRTPDSFVVLDYDTLFAALNADRDRKSTRLNSSHVAISYAVFCLKKK